MINLVLTLILGISIGYGLHLLLELHKRNKIKSTGMFFRGKKACLNQGFPANYYSEKQQLILVR